MLYVLATLWIISMGNLIKMMGNIYTVCISIFFLLWTNYPEPPPSSFLSLL